MYNEDYKLNHSTTKGGLAAYLSLPNVRNALCNLTVLFVVSVVVYENFIPPHPKYPHLGLVSNNAYSLGMFGLMDLFALSKMWD
jgi:hypothetical protein